MLLLALMLLVLTPDSLKTQAVHIESISMCYHPALPRNCHPPAHSLFPRGTSYHPLSTACVEPGTQQAGQRKQAAAFFPAALPQAREQTKELNSCIARDTLIDTYSFTSE